jgi:hypothetical protein
MTTGAGSFVLRMSEGCMTRGIMGWGCTALCCAVLYCTVYGVTDWEIALLLVFYLCIDLLRLVYNARFVKHSHLVAGPPNVVVRLRWSIKDELAA